MSTRAARARDRQRAITLHRGLGIAAAALVVVLALTGIALNHAEKLALYEERIESEWLLEWYGLMPEEEPTGFELGGSWLVVIDRQLFLDGEPLLASDSPIIGALALEHFHVVAARDAVWLVTREQPAAIADRLDSASLPGVLARVGRDGGGALVSQLDDGSWHRVDADFMSWEPLERAPSADWSAASPPPAELRDAALARHRGDGLTEFRLLADIHSGRILGGFGVFLMDGAAVLMLLLTASGLYAWAKTHRPGRAGSEATTSAAEDGNSASG